MIRRERRHRAVTGCNRRLLERFASCSPLLIRLKPADLSTLPCRRLSGSHFRHRPLHPQLHFPSLPTLHTLFRNASFTNCTTSPHPCPLLSGPSRRRTQLFSTVTARITRIRTAVNSHTHLTSDDERVRPHQALKARGEALRWCPCHQGRWFRTFAVVVLPAPDKNPHRELDQDFVEQRRLAVEKCISRITRCRRGTLS